MNLPNEDIPVRVAEDEVEVNTEYDPNCCVWNDSNENDTCNHPFLSGLFTFFPLVLILVEPWTQITSKIESQVVCVVVEFICVCSILILEFQF